MKRLEDGMEACAAIIRSGEARPGTLTGAERDELFEMRVMLAGLNDRMSGAAGALLSARARRRTALVGLRGRLLAAKAHVHCLAAMSGIVPPAPNLGKTVWTVSRVLPLASRYRQVLDASGADPLTGVIRDGLAAAVEAFARTDDEVRGREAGLAILRVETYAALRRVEGRSADLRAMMPLRLPRDERRAFSAACAAPHPAANAA